MARLPSATESLIGRLPGCARLEPDALAALVAASRLVELPVGARLIREGDVTPDWFAVVESGALQVSRLDVETDEILDYLAAGDVFDPGTPGLPAVGSASAAEPTRCLLVPQSLLARHRGALAVESPATFRGELALFVRRVGDLIKGPPVTAPSGATVGAAARLMASRGVGSVIVLGGEGEPLGIVTDRDLRSRVVAEGLASTTPLEAVMSAPLVTTGPERLAFDALLEMTRRGIRHLPVMAGDRLVGVVSSHDILLLHGAHPVALVRDIEAALSVDALAAATPRVEAMVVWLHGLGARAFDVGRLVAELNDRLVRRALSLVTATLEHDGRGSPPVPYAWLALGSEGRREQTLKTDQDNGLVYQDPPDELAAGATAYFAALAAQMAEALLRLGFPRCEGDFMASNPRWRQPERTWRQYFATWMDTPEPRQILNACLFFDLRVVAGDETVGKRLWDWVCERAPTQRLFLGHMARAAVDRHVPLGFFGGFAVERSGVHKGAIDIKARGVLPVTQAMRVHALSVGCRDTNTVERLDAAAAAGIFTDAEARDLREAYEVIVRLRLAHQLACVDAGSPPDNFVTPGTLGKADRLLLREAFRSVAWLQRHLEDRFQTSLLA